MIVRSLTSTGDWTFGKGIEDYQFNLNAVIQEIQTRLLSFRTDCFFAITDGVDWFNLLGAKDQLAISVAVGAQILGTNYQGVQVVTGILQLFISTNASRQISISYNAQTIYGATGTQQFQYDLPQG